MPVLLRRVRADARGSLLQHAAGGEHVRRRRTAMQAHPSAKMQGCHSRQAARPPSALGRSVLTYCSFVSAAHVRLAALLRRVSLRKMAAMGVDASFCAGLPAPASSRACQRNAESVCWALHST